MVNLYAIFHESRRGRINVSAFYCGVVLYYDTACFKAWGVFWIILLWFVYLFKDVTFDLTAVNCQNSIYHYSCNSWTCIVEISAWSEIFRSVVCVIGALSLNRSVCSTALHSGISAVYIKRTLNINAVHAHSWSVCASPNSTVVINYHIILYDNASAEAFARYISSVLFSTVADSKIWAVYCCVMCYCWKRSAANDRDITVRSINSAVALIVFGCSLAWKRAVTKINAADKLYVQILFAFNVYKTKSAGPFAVAVYTFAYSRHIVAKKRQGLALYIVFPALFAPCFIRCYLFVAYPYAIFCDRKCVQWCNGHYHT